MDKLKFEKSIEPHHIELAMDWQKQVTALGKQNNILGDNGQVLIDKEQIYIPVSPTTQEYLAFYQAYLIQPEEYIQFEAPPLPDLENENIKELCQSISHES